MERFFTQSILASLAQLGIVLRLELVLRERASIRAGRKRQTHSYELGLFLINLGS
jgi:hypothetical protein